MTLWSSLTPKSLCPDGPWRHSKAGRRRAGGRAQGRTRWRESGHPHARLLSQFPLSMGKLVKLAERGRQRNRCGTGHDQRA